jgi:hypothetical protein
MSRPGGLGNATPVRSRSTSPVNDVAVEPRVAEAASKDATVLALKAAEVPLKDLQAIIVGSEKEISANIQHVVDLDGRLDILQAAAGEIIQEAVELQASEVRAKSAMDDGIVSAELDSASTATPLDSASRA